jgi:hypothetical protein
MAAIEEQVKHRTPWKNMLYYFALKLLNHMLKTIQVTFQPSLEQFTHAINKKKRMKCEKLT